MAKRTTNQPERQPTKLTVGKDFFRQQLEERIAIGDELLKRHIQTYDQLDKAKEDYYNWNDYNSEILKQSFNNEFNEYKDSYDSANFSPIIFGGQPRDNLDKPVALKLAKLVSSVHNSCVLIKC